MSDYVKYTGHESEINIMSRINPYLDAYHTSRQHKNDYDYYDIKITNEAETKTVVHIEYELTTKDSSNWKKGKCWFANKRGYSKRHLKEIGRRCYMGIRVPMRKDKTWELIPHSYWMKENIERDAGHCIHGIYILKQPNTYWPVPGWAYDKNWFRYMYGDELGDNGVYDTDLLSMLQYIERNEGYKFLKNKYSVFSQRSDANFEDRDIPRKKGPMDTFFQR